MAFGHFDFFSKNLCRHVEFNILLPNDPRYSRADNPHYQRNMKILYLLHGHNNNCWEPLMNLPLRIAADKYNMAIILPSGENSFYLDMKGAGNAYAAYVGEELVDYTKRTFGLSEKREDTYVAGISMGGFGAIHAGLGYPERFEKILAFSPALIVYDIVDLPSDYVGDGMDYEYYTRVFGELGKLEGSLNNPEQMFLKLKAENKRIPALYMVCGTEDELLSTNRRFYHFLSEHEFPVTYHEDQGEHDYDFWRNYLDPGIEWLLQ